MSSFHKDYPYYTHIKTSEYNRYKELINNMDLGKTEFDIQFNGLQFFTVYFKQQHNLVWFLLQGK